MTSLIVGCPTRNRTWILPAWKQAVLIACEKANLSPTFQMVVGVDDEPTFELLMGWNNTTINFVEEPVRDDVRSWSKGRLAHMVTLRNLLLERIRAESPDLFLSVDSDIILHPDSVVSMLDAFDQHPDSWAMGSKTFLGTSEDFPNYGNWRGNHDMGMVRTPSNDLMRVGVIAAIKLMKPEAYHVDYKFHRGGEDLGWSSNIAGAGGLLSWDGRVISIHYFTKDEYDTRFERLGNRYKKHGIEPT